MCFCSFAGILMKFSAALQNPCWRVHRLLIPAPVSLRRRTSRWALWMCKSVTVFICVSATTHFLLHPLQNTRENPIHIINVSIKTADTEDDDALVTALTAFAQSKVSLTRDWFLSKWDMFFIIKLKIVFVLQKAVLFEYGIRRITFLIAQKVIQHQSQ